MRGSIGFRMSRRRILVAILVLGLAAAGFALRRGRDGQDPALRFTFAVYGDCRHNDEVHRRICESIRRTAPSFVACTGDLMDRGDLESSWDDFRAITRELRAGVPYYAVMGDHDGYGKPWFAREFGLERLYFDRVVGDFHLFFLNSADGFEDPEQLKWLEERAAASKSRHKFAFFHRPPFMIDRRRGGEAQAIRDRIHAILVKHKFCAAFCGHQHAFYTTLRDGVRYVVTAGGGANLWKELDGALGQPGDLWRRCYHYVGCTVAGSQIVAQVVGDDGVPMPELSFTLCEH